jgi:excisionase family DNA binding protein
MDGQLLTSSELADRLRISPQTLARWRGLPDLNGLRFVKVGDQIRYRADDVEAWISSREVKSG